ncbi:MAG: cytochrome c [Hyphomicrobiaceae bacterium]|nr:cytochrome c [Hyphomicrobiaceae bacterium]
MSRYLRLAAMPIAAALGTLPAVSHADDRALRGSAIAAERCGKCHAVGVTDASPHKITPPLRDLGTRFPVEMLVEALASGSIGGHDEMPQFDLGRDGVEALVAYIDSLTPAGPHYLKPKP